MDKPKPPVVRGLDDKRRLLRFFAAKNHRNLVLRVVDMLEMRTDELDHLIKTVVIGALGKPEWPNIMMPMSPKQYLLKWFPGGWVVCPFEDLLNPLDLPAVERLQQSLSEYRAVRYEKGEPNKSEPCQTCQGSGRHAGRTCKGCEGDGLVYTFLEMSEDEARLAEGGA